MFSWQQKSEKCRNSLQTKEFAFLQLRNIKRKNDFFDRSRKIFKFDDIYRRGKDLEKRKDGLSNLEIEEYLRPIPNFLGVIFDDDLKHLSLLT